MTLLSFFLEMLCDTYMFTACIILVYMVIILEIVKARARFSGKPMNSGILRWEKKLSASKNFKRVHGLRFEFEILHHFYWNSSSSSIHHLFDTFILLFQMFLNVISVIVFNSKMERLSVGCDFFNTKGKKRRVKKNKRKSNKGKLVIISFSWP